MDEIIGHRKTKDAIPKSKGYISVNGQDRMVIKTRGWQFQVRWKDGDTSWVNLRGIEESNPVEISEYVLAHGLDKEPSFNWWMRKSIRRKERIISKVNSIHKVHDFHA